MVINEPYRSPAFSSAARRKLRAAQLKTTKGGLAKMPTLQAAELNHFEPGVDSSTQFAPAAPHESSPVQTIWRTRLSRVRGYFALGTLFVVTLSGYAAIFILLDRFLSSGTGG